ncbi:hypothetical protein Trydic_g18794 [Trypoxylus dichotomus]
MHVCTCAHACDKIHIRLILTYTRATWITASPSHIAYLLRVLFAVGTTHAPHYNAARVETLSDGEDVEELPDKLNKEFTEKTVATESLAL